jgi:hypothetical protein
MAQASVAFRYFDGSGAFDCFRRDFRLQKVGFTRVPKWATSVEQANTVSVGASILLTEVRPARYLSREEQSVFDAALRRSVKVLSSGKRQI